MRKKLFCAKKVTTLPALTVHVKLLLIMQQLDVAIAKVQIEKRIRFLKIFKQKYSEKISNILNSYGTMYRNVDRQ
jgi:hypothetical protein